MSRHVRFYRRLVRLYPLRFRRRFGDQMVVLFADQLRDARSSGRPMAVATLWARSLLDLFMTAPAQHLRERRAVQQTVEPGIAVEPVTPQPLRRLATVLAAGPLLLTVFLSAAAPGFMDPLYAKPPETLGLPTGVFAMAFAGVLSLLAIWVVRQTRSGVASLLAIVCLAIPAWILILVSPALILAVQNL